MTRIAALASLLALATPAVWVQISDDLPAKGTEAQEARELDEFEYAERQPFSLLAHLIRADTLDVKVVTVDDAPRNWIKESHIELLIQLLDSAEPCAGIHSMRDSFIDFNRKHRSSTVGHESAYLIAGYRHGLYPKGHAYSVDWKLDLDEIRAWWKQQQSK